MCIIPEDRQVLNYYNNKYFHLLKRGLQSLKHKDFKICLPGLIALRSAKSAKRLYEVQKDHKMNALTLSD